MVILEGKPKESKIKLFFQPTDKKSANTAARQANMFYLHAMQIVVLKSTGSSALKRICFKTYLFLLHFLVDLET